LFINVSIAALYMFKESVHDGVTCTHDGLGEVLYSCVFLYVQKVGPCFLIFTAIESILVEEG
jgi:hypothetical protein